MFSSGNSQKFKAHHCVCSNVTTYTKLNFNLSYDATIQLVFLQGHFYEGEATGRDQKAGLFRLLEKGCVMTW